MYYIYMIKNSYNDLYVGVSENPEQRLQEHNSHRGAQFTESKKSFQIVFIESYKTLSEARKREIQIKKWRRDKKEMLVQRFQKNLPTKI